MKLKEPQALIDWLKSELLNLPGEIAHKDMIPYRLTASEVHKSTIKFRLSAVLILLYFDNGEPHFILTERQHYAGKHSGQISLPGGKVEERDKNTAETALREMEEEIGVAIQSVELLGQLTEVYVPVSQFLIHPYLGYSSHIPAIIPDAREVKTVLHCAISELINEENRILTKFETSKGILMKNVPAFLIQEKIVWGATAIILNEFKHLLKRLA